MRRFIINILDGKILAQSIKDALKKEIDEIKKKTGHAPSVISILIGNDPRAAAYANSQKKVADALGIKYTLENISKNISQDEMERLIERCNNDHSVTGIMIQKPVPSQINFRALSRRVDPKKDIEGIHPANMGDLIRGETNIIPSTPAAVMEHIKASGVNISGKKRSWSDAARSSVNRLRFFCWIKMQR